MATQTLNRIGKYSVKLLTTRLDMDVEFQSPLPRGAKIIAPNHPTTVDPFLIMTITHEPVYVLVTESAFKMWLLGRYLRAAGHIPVVTKDRRAAFEAAHQLLLEGKTIAIFPEGALSPLDGSLARAHTGAIRLSLLTGAPIIPVGIALDADRIRFKGAGVKNADGVEEVARLYTRGMYAVTVGAPMVLKGAAADREAVRRLSEHLMQRIARLARQSTYRMQAEQAALAERQAAAPDSPITVAQFERLLADSTEKMARAAGEAVRRIPDGTRWTLRIASDSAATAGSSSRAILAAVR